MNFFLSCNRIFTAVFLIFATVFFACKSSDAGMGSDESGESAWTKLYSGNVRSVIRLPNGHLLISVPLEGVKKSSDGGKTWDLKLVGKEVGDIAFDSQFYRLYLATGDSGIYRSDNGGESWNKIKSGDFTTIAVSLTGDVYAGIDNVGLIISRDGGVSWSSFDIETRDIRGFAFTPADALRAYLASVRFMWGSTNGGANWEKANRNNLPGEGTLVGILADRVDAKKVWVGMTQYGAWKTTDSGNTWVDASAGLPKEFDLYTVMAFAQNGTTLYTGLNGGRGVYKSDDDGANWVAAGLAGKSIAQNGLVASAGKLYACTDGGLFQLK